MSKIRLLYTLSSLHGGGAERVALTLLKNLDPIRCDSTLFLHKNEGKYLNQIPRDLNIIYLLSSTQNKLIKNILRIIALPILLNKTYFLSKKYDILIAGIESTYITYATILSGLLNKKPVIVIIHNDISNNYALKKSFHYRIIKFLYKYCTHCICVSNGVLSGLIHEMPYLAQKSTVIYNPFVIDEIIQMGEEPINIDIKGPFIISSGRLQKIKRFDLLINAHQKVLTQGIKHSLLIIGEGEYMFELKKIAFELGVTSTVHFLGFDYNPHRWVSKAFCFVLSSENEGFGNVIVEAMAVGTPVISTDCPSGPREILDNGKYGILVPNKDVDKLANAIMNLFNDQTSYNYYKSICTERSKKYSIESVIVQWEDLINHVLVNFNISTSKQ